MITGIIKLRKVFKYINPSGFYIVTGFFYGTLMLLITPPFQSPDEINHFYRAYQVSTGRVLPKKMDDRLGGYIPKSFLKSVQPFAEIRWNPKAKLEFKTITGQFSIKLDESDKVFVDFPNTALYSPISYIPQSFAILVLRCLGISPILIFYLTRFFVLLVWVFSFSLVIKIMPTHKWLFVFFGLLPMSVFINMSISADVVTNILSFMLMAGIFKISYETKLFSSKWYIVILALTVLLALAKIVYIPMVLLFLIIPSSNFCNKKQRIFQTSLLLIAGFGLALLWSQLAGNYYIPYKYYNPEFREGITLIECADVNQQLEYILHNGFYIVEVMANSMISSFEMYFSGYIGTFGWLDTPLPFWLVIGVYLILLLQLFLSNESSFDFKLYQKITIILVLIFIVLLILLSQHLSWDCVGGNLIYTLQGRYFIPVFPLFFVMLSDLKIGKTQNMHKLAALFIIFCLSYSIYILLNRYYS